MIPCGDKYVEVVVRCQRVVAKRRRKKKLSPFTLAGVIVLCLVLCGTVTYKTATLKSQSKSYQKQIEQLKEQKSELKDEPS